MESSPSAEAMLCRWAHGDGSQGAHGPHRPAVVFILPIYGAARTDRAEDGQAGGRADSHKCAAKSRAASATRARKGPSARAASWMAMHSGRESKGRCRRRQTASGSAHDGASPPRGSPPLRSSPSCACRSLKHALWPSLGGRHVATAARGDVVTGRTRPAPSSAACRLRSCTRRPVIAAAAGPAPRGQRVRPAPPSAPRTRPRPYRSSGTASPPRRSPRLARISDPSLRMGTSAAAAVRQGKAASSRQISRPRPSPAPGSATGPTCGPRTPQPVL